MKLTAWILSLVVLFWIGLHTSQSGIDLMDTLLIITGLVLAFKRKEFAMWLSGFQPVWLWPVWLAIVALSFVFGAPVEFMVALKLFLEFKWIVSFLCFIYLFKKLEWTDKQVRWLSLTLLVLSVVDFVVFRKNYSIDPRAGGLFGHSMPFAHTMGPAALLLLFWGLRKFSRAASLNESYVWRAVYVLAPALATLMLVLTLTRGVWLGFAVALLVCAALCSWRALALSFGALAVMAGVMIATSSRMQDRVMGKTNAETQSNSERLWYWKENLKIFRDYPVFGIGYSQNNVHVEEYLRRDGIDWMGGAHAHNQHIHFLAGTGVGGVLCFWIFLGSIFCKVGVQIARMRNQKKFSSYYYLLVGALGGLICFTLGGLTESNFSISKNRYMFLFIAALAYAIVEKARTSRAEPLDRN